MSDIAAALPLPRTAVDDDHLHDVLLSVATAGAAPAPVVTALQAALDGVCDALGFPVGHAYLREGDQLVPTPLWHLTNPFRFAALVRLTAATHVVPDVGLVGRTWHEARPVRLGVIHDDPLFRRSRVALTAGLRAAVGCPVVVDGRVAAVLEFFAPRHLGDDPLLIAFLEDVTAALAAVLAADSVVAAG
jgi:methyl-accepting chemotaxis protein